MNGMMNDRKDDKGYKIGFKRSVWILLKENIEGLKSYKRNLSIDNGIHYVDLDDLTESEKETINEYWCELVNFMDSEDMERTNDIVDIDIDDNLNNKIVYLKTYLSVAKHDLILG